MSQSGNPEKQLLSDFGRVENEALRRKTFLFLRRHCGSRKAAKAAMLPARAAMQLHGDE